MEWSISNSYTIASQQSSYVTLNLYASTGNGTEDIVAPYNLTILNPAYVDAFSWNFEVSSFLRPCLPLHAAAPSKAALPA